jgi:protein transport protein SEC61 subunit gamma-like protein
MTIAEKTKSFFVKCKRVWQVMRKPTRKEFEQVAKISAIGIAIIGVFGFLISLVIAAFVK